MQDQPDCGSRWKYVLIGVWVMMVVSIYQYSWSLFAFSLSRELNWSVATVSLTFTIFNVATFLQPFTGIIADVRGPRGIAVLGALLVAAGMVLSSYVSEPWQLHLFYGIGGAGVGVFYGIATATAIKWFPDRRGFATGIVVFGFGAGTALFNWLVQILLEGYGFRPTFRIIGVFMFLVLVPAALMYRYPPAGWKPAAPGSPAKAKAVVDFRPQEMMATRQWFLIYFCFSFTIAIVLLFAAQMKMLAKEYQLPQVYFDILLVLFPIGNGLSRIVSGGVSDKLGREKTMTLFYGALGLSIFALIQWGGSPVAFVALVFVAALLGGSPFALYPATIGDYFGPKYSTVNYGITYTAKAWAGLISGWLSGYLMTQFGSFRIPLLIIAAGSLLAAVISSPGLMKAPKRREISGLKDIGASRTS
ncbi:MAG TPA: OFA family MFS transporter [Thermodesulfobacteriota bacterium]|nr:OFA family MFS transporter [Thermodesulfobacteriota bacterium]